MIYIKHILFISYSNLTTEYQNKYYSCTKHAYIGIKKQFYTILFTKKTFLKKALPDRVSGPIWTGLH